MDERVRALIESVRGDPDARAALLSALLPDDVMDLPRRVTGIESGIERLVEAQTRTEFTLQQLITRVDTLTDLVGTLTARMDGLVQLMDVLTERMDALTARMDALVGNMDALTVRVDALTERMDALVGQMDALTVRMDALVERMDALTVRMDALTERMDALVERMDALTERMDALTVRMDALTVRMDALVEAQLRTEIAVQTLSDRFAKQLPRIDTAIGYVIERRYDERASSYFAPIARRIRVLDRLARDELLDDALDAGELTRDEARSVRLADTIARARRDDQVVHLVVEASYTVDERDVQRAVDRARLLSRVVGQTIPIVAGEYIDEDAQHAALAGGVYQVLDGTVTGPDGIVLS